MAGPHPHALQNLRVCTILIDKGGRPQGAVKMAPARSLSVKWNGGMAEWRGKSDFLMEQSQYHSLQQ